MTTAFASRDEPGREALLAAPVRWPRPEALDAPLEVSPAKAAAAAEALGLHTVGDLLVHLPRDRREARTVAALAPGEQATVVVEVRGIASRPVRRRGMRPLVEATVADETGPMKATFFNQPWLVRKYPPGTRLVLHGTYEARNRFRVTSHAPTAEAAGAADADVAHYPATDGLSSTQILALVRAHQDAIRAAPEPLPGRLRAGEGLPDRPAALAAAHGGDLEGGRRRLAFDELLLVQLDLLRRRAHRRATRDAPRLDGEMTLTRRWLDELLPFAPTDDQRGALEAVTADLAGGRPMQRLLMGEVGSGKTVVALFAMLRAVEQGWQAALMAPTETLAEQHFATLAGAPARRGGAGRACSPAPRPRPAGPTSSGSSPRASCRSSSAPMRSSRTRSSSTASRSPSSTSSTASASASARGSTPRPGGWGRISSRTCCT